MGRDRSFSVSLFLSPSSAFVSSTHAASSFAHDYDDTTEVSSTARVRVNGTAREVTLQPDANVLPDRGTLLFTALGGDTEITSPAMARGLGGTPEGVTYTSGGGGYRGEAVTIAGSGHAITFPARGNFDPRKGTIDFWMSLSNWSLDAKGHTADHPRDQAIFYAADGDKSVRLVRASNGKLRLQFEEDGDGVYGKAVDTGQFVPGTWHHFTFTWNMEEDVFYIASWLDGAYQGELADPSPNTFDPERFSSFDPSIVFIGNRSDGGAPLNGKLDELRITDTEYSATAYPGRVGILTSAALDTRVPSPVWGTIKWNETLPPKTDIELQTSTSDDGSNWTSWFSADKAMITITFDDGYSSTYDVAYPVMKALGFSGVAYVTTEWIGEPNRMSVAQLRRLQDAGWEIGGHGSEHVSSKQSFAESKAWLIRHDLGHSAFAYPGGAFDQKIIGEISEYYATARTSINQYQTYAPKYGLYHYGGDSGPRDVISWIDSVLAKKAWGILTFHSIGQPQTPANVSLSDFTAIMQHLSDRQLDVFTIADAMARLALHTNKGGDRIVSPNKRYIRYRAILHSYDGIHTPTLSSVVLSAPTRLYQDIVTTISSNGSYDHAAWPQTTDTPIDEFVVTPDTGSVTVHVDTWNTSGSFYRKWTEVASREDVATSHSMGNLVPGNHYRVKQDGNIRDVDGASESGQITFKYASGASTVAFEIEQDTSGPSISDVSSSATATEAKVTWTTGESATSAVDYGLTPSYGTSTPETDPSSGTTNHSVSLSGLHECTTYHFRVRSKGSAADAAASGGTFTTSGNCPKATIETGAAHPPDEPTGRPKKSIPWELVISSGIVAAGVVLFVLSLRRRRSSFRR